MYGQKGLPQWGRGLKVLSSQIGSSWEWFHWIGSEKDINRYMFLIFNFTFKSLKILQSSELLRTKMNPTSCLFRSRFVYNHFFLLAGALLMDEKIGQSTALFWFGLQDVGILQNILLTSCNPKSSCWISRIFGAWFWEKIAVCAHTNRVLNKQGLDSFLYEAAQIFEVFSNIQNEN